MISLPNNGFGVAIMLCLMALAAIVPFVVVLWLVLKFAPWWVAVPIAITSSVFSFPRVVHVVFRGGAK